MALSSPSRSDPRLWLPLVAAAALAVLAVAFASIGNPFPLGITVITLAETTVRAGLPAAAYLLAAIGLGRLLAPLYRGSRDPVAMQISLGLGAMWTISHLLGVLGVFGGVAGRVVAAGVIAAGLALVVAQVVRASRAGEASGSHGYAAQSGRRGVALVGAPALALLLVAASNPPGWLWESEGRGYDALSYHVQLPQEWIAMGRLAPLEHNVYSFLPSYMEAAFYHTGVVMAGSRGLLAGEGFGVLMAQWLHAGVAVICAVLVGRLVMVLAMGRSTADNQFIAGLLAGALFLSVPWVIVTGSLAYNDLGVAALLAGALIAAMDRNMPTVRRGLIVGLLVGIACGVKPTALLFAGIPAGVALLASSRPREWGVLIAAGSVAGLAMLAPWLIRNAAYAGNPVFPFMTSVFGPGHWSEEQAARYAAAHSFDGGLLERLRLLVMIDPGDPAGARHRGLLHPQWSAFWLVVAAAGVTALASARTRFIGALLCVMLALQLAAWLFATHLQSRFLLPLAVPGAALAGIIVADRLGRARLVGISAAGIVLVVALTSVVLFAREPRIDGAGPNQMLVAGPSARSGELFRHVSARERQALLAGAEPEVFANLGLADGAVVYLLGDATPLYYTVPVIYATTWDRSMLGMAMREFPDQPARWVAHLRSAGVTHVLVNQAELERLERSGFLDPVLSREGLGEFVGHLRGVQVWAQGRVVLYEVQKRDGGG